MNPFYEPSFLTDLGLLEISIEIIEFRIVIIYKRFNGLGLPLGLKKSVVTNRITSNFTTKLRTSHSLSHYITRPYQVLSPNEWMC